MAISTRILSISSSVLLSEQDEDPRFKVELHMYKNVKSLNNV